MFSLYRIFAPEPFGRFWGIDVTSDKTAPYEAMHFCVFFLKYHIQKILLLQGVKPHKALGFSSLVGMVLFVDGFFGNMGMI